MEAYDIQPRIAGLLGSGMDFDYTDEQRYLRDEARRFLAAACPLAATRRAQDTRAFDRDLWSRIAAQGWLGTVIPEAYGGLGLSHVELGAISEEIGAALAPLPWGPTLYLFAEAVTLAGTEEQKQRLLRGVAEGRLIGCGALWGEVTARDGRLTGVAQPVVGGGVADWAVVLATEDGAPAMFLVALDGVTRTPLEAIDGSMDVARLDFADTPGERLSPRRHPRAGGGPEAPASGSPDPRLRGDDELLDTLLARGAVMTAFEQVGGADRCLRMTTDYVKERQAFGGPVGRFQAVKHKLADLYVANELARSHAYHGVWAVAAGDDAALIRAAAAARVAACDAYWLASKEGVHLHGAIGFTWEHDAHLFYRRAHHLSLWLGAPGWWKDRLYERLAA